MKTILKKTDHLKSTYEIGLYPVIEIELNGKIPLNKVIDTIHIQFEIPYKLIKADIEYFGKTNYGKLILLLQGSTEDTAKTIQYFHSQKMKSNIMGYA